MRHAGHRLQSRLGAGGDRRGVTGFIVEDDNGAIGAVDRLGTPVARRRSGGASRQRFTARRMAQDYLAVYRSLMDASRRICGWFRDEAPASLASVRDSAVAATRC